MTGWQVIGITDEQTECEVCGKVELKSTVLLELGDGSQLYAGTTCAARKLRTTTGKIRSAIDAYVIQREIERSRNRRVARDIVRVLGGCQSAREMFRAWRAEWPEGAPFFKPSERFSECLEWAREVLAA